MIARSLTSSYDALHMRPQFQETLGVYKKIGKEELRGELSDTERDETGFHEPNRRELRCVLNNG